MRGQQWVVWLGGVLGIAAVSLTVGGQGGPKAPAGAGEIVVGASDLETARANRLLIEKRLTEARNQPVQLPAGVIHLDKNVTIGPEHSGATLQGAGMSRTVLRNSHNAWPENRTLLIHGQGLDYVTATERVEGATATLSKDASDALPNFAAGRVVWAFRWDAYHKQNPPPRQRYVVRAVDAARRVVTFDRPADPALLSLKWSDGSPIKDASAGALEVRLEVGGDAAGLTPGRWVYVSDGPALAHEARGEFRRVASVDAATGVVRLDRQLRRSYTAAALVRIKPVDGVTVRDLTVAQPVNHAADPFLGKFCTGLRLDRVRFGAPGEVAASPGVAASGDVTFTDCESSGVLGINSCHDVAVRGGRVAGTTMEEGCFDISYDNVLVAAPGGVHGVHAYLGCERIALRNCRIEGFGRNGGGGHGSPLAITGRDSLIRDVTTTSSDPATDNYLAGDGLRIDGLVTDVGVAITQGKGVTIRDSRASKRWDLRAGTTGFMENCTVAGMPTFAGQTPPLGWRVDGRVAGQRGRGND